MAACYTKPKEGFELKTADESLCPPHLYINLQSDSEDGKHYYSTEKAHAEVFPIHMGQGHSFVPMIHFITVI
jgi:hypothetical protein